MKRVLLNYQQVIELAKAFQKMNTSDDMDDYQHGLIDGIEFVLFLTERMEE